MSHAAIITSRPRATTASLLAPVPALGMAFTASRLAWKSNRSPKSVTSMLRDIPASQFLDVKHSTETVPAWSVDSLPPSFRAELAARARDHRTIEDYLLHAGERWEPEVALKDCITEDVDYAARLQRALTPFLLNEHPDWTAREFEERGAEAHRFAFGDSRGIHPRHWRRIYSMVLERARGGDDFERVELFLPPKQTRRPEPSAVVTGAVEEIFDLGAVIRGCADPLRPSLVEWELIRRRICEEYDALTWRGLTPKQRTRRLIDQLEKTLPFHGQSRDAIAMKLSRWRGKWVEHGGKAEAVADGRANNTGNHDNYYFPKSDFDLLVGTAVYRHGGDVAAGWRELWHARKFSPATMEHFGKWNRSRKSDVPKSVMEAVRFYVEVLLLWVRGERGYNSMRPTVNVSPDALPPMLVMTADDLTPDCYYGVEVVPATAEHPGRDRMVRGQILLFMDFASMRIIGSVVSPAPAYNSLMILGEMTRIFRDIAVPLGVQMEKNIWEAHIVKGRSKSAPSMSPTERESRFQKMGVKFSHTLSPQGKARMERAIRAVQELFRAEAGWCGNDEKVTCPEDTRRRMEEVNSGKRRARDAGFHDLDSFNARFGEICRSYNATRQEGDVLKGLSPDEHWEKFINPEFLPIEFTPALEGLLTNHDEQVKVTVNGLRLPFGKGVYYKDDTGHLARHLGETLKVHLPILEWSEHGLPERVIVSAGEDQFPVYRETIVSPVEWLFDPDYTGLKKAKRENAAMEAPLKDLLKKLKPRFNTLPPAKRLPTRRTIGDAQTVQKGAALKIHQTTPGTRERKRDMGTQLAGVLGGMSRDEESRIITEGQGIRRAEHRADETEAAAAVQRRANHKIDRAALLAETEEREARLKARGYFD